MMLLASAFSDDRPVSGSLLPLAEMGAYEALWLEPKASFKTIAAKFAADPAAVPSDFVSREAADKAYREASSLLKSLGVDRWGIRVHGSGDYPQTLRDAVEPVELLYYRGEWELAYSPSVSVVGTRKPSDEGLARARNLARMLTANKFSVVSGLAEGIDTAAHNAAIECGGRTIAVMGTHIGKAYPSSNFELQQKIAAKHLLISQVPILRYERDGARNPTVNRWFFPERNKTMSALTRATIIVEAGETSGTLVQAKAALEQGRKLLLLDSLFSRSDLTWPGRFLERGAIRVKTESDILDNLVDQGSAEAFSA